MDAIVLKALTKDPNYRYQSADEMRADIEACLDGQPVAATAAMGSVGYGGYPDDQPTTALRSADGGATTMLPPMNPDDGGYGYDDRPDRRRQQKKSNTSTILLVVAAVLVLVGAVLIGRWVFSGDGVGNNTVAVPNLVNQSQKDAESALTNSDLKVGEVTKKPCETQPAGKICAQNPEPKTTVDKNSSVDLVVSTGAPKVTVPSVIDLDLDEAKTKLEGDDYELVVKTKFRESSDEANTVLDQDPVKGEEVEKGSTITLVIAKEEEKSTVPDVLGKTCDEAKAQMTANNLVGTCTDVETQDPNQVGKVIATSPEANSSADKNSTVTIQIGKQAQQKTQVPNVVGQRVAQAKQILQQAGFTNIQFAEGSDQNDNAFVTQQDPAGNQPVDDPANTQVTLTTLGVGGNGGGDNGGGNGGIFGGVTGTSARTED